MNGSVIQFTNLMRFPQLGPISHKFTMRGGHPFVCIKPHSEHFPRGERCRGHVREPRGEEELEADHWQETTVAFWDPLALHWITESAASHLNRFSPLAAAREAARCALAIRPEEQILKRNLNYTMKFILAMKTESQKGFSLITKDEGSFFFLFVS